MASLSNRTVKVSHRRLVVAVPAYNEEAYLQRTLESLQAQTCDDFAVFITDNASSDGTGAIARAAAERNSHVYYHRHEHNIGAVENFNFALSHSSSPYFMWLGAHDVITPDFLARHLEALEGNPSYSLSFSHTAWIDDTDRIFRLTNAGDLGSLSASAPLRYIQSARRLSECTAINNVLRRAALDGEAFDTVAGADHILLSHLLYRGPAHCIAEPLYRRREKNSPREDYMTRLTGRSGQKRDYRPMVAGYLSDFEALAGSGWKARLQKRWLRATLYRKFQIDGGGSSFAYHAVLLSEIGLARFAVQMFKVVRRKLSLRVGTARR